MRTIVLWRIVVRLPVGHHRGVDRHGTETLLVGGSCQRAWMIVQGFFVGKVGGTVVVRKVPVNVHVFKHGLLALQRMQQL